PRERGQEKIYNSHLNLWPKAAKEPELMTTSLSPLNSAPTTIGPMERYDYRLEFQRSSDGKRLDAGRVNPYWLEFLWEQAIFQGQRRGTVGPDPSQAIINEHPQFLKDPEGSLKSISVSAGDGTNMHETQFELSAAFSAPGEEALKKLVEGGLLTAEDKATFRVYAKPSAKVAEQETNGVRATLKRDPLPLLDEGCLEDYMEKATLNGELDEKDHPLFVPRELFEKAREYCFKTGRQEGGAMIVARMYRQTEPQPEIFVVAHAVMELRHAKQSLFGFEPTSDTFADLNKQLHLRRSRLGFPDEMPAVLVHNHPFEPSVRDDGEANCPTCPLQQTCELTSSFYSASDVNFHLSMYGRQPFVTGVVIGLTPRQEDDVRMFCLDGTRTRERGFYWLD
ncbi:MAG: hypothetical protein KDA84_21175, partial [Planctomycetaceae bacterium]|nr:hypothetical protein [Planctomycetaceae bacterium]